VNRIARLGDILAQAVAEAGENASSVLDNRHGYEEASQRDRQRRRAASQQILGEETQADRGRDGATSWSDGSRSHRGTGVGGRALTHFRVYDESEHPRDELGRWTDAGGGGGGGSADEDGGEPSAPERADHVNAVFRVQGRPGRTALTFQNLTTDGNERFHSAILRAKTTDKFGASVHAYPANDYRGMNLFVTPDNNIGFAIKSDGDIVSAFKHPNSDAKEAAQTMLSLAVNRGGRKLDAFDTVLPRIYSDAGFRAVARLAWNDQFAPEGWNKDTYARFNSGKPDVVFMVHDPANASAYKAGDGKRVESYDEGVAEQTKALAEIDARTPLPPPAPTPSPPPSPPPSPSSGNQYGLRQGDVARFKELKGEWAKVNNELLAHVDDPEGPESRVRINRLEAIVKEMHTLRADPGGPAGIGLPGGPLDVAIVGAGPGGLTAGINGAAEGLDTMVIEANVVPGGQAKFSSRIENFPGFPIGVTGDRLTQGMYQQAQRLGAQTKLGVRVTGMTYDSETGLKHLTLSNGEKIASRTVILAGGVEFRRMTFPGSEGPGVIVGDGKALAKAGADGNVCVIGGSNGDAHRYAITSTCWRARPSLAA
jgi:hypothetical protein